MGEVSPYAPTSLVATPSAGSNAARNACLLCNPGWMILAGIIFVNNFDHIVVYNIYFANIAGLFKTYFSKTNNFYWKFIDKRIY